MEELESQISELTLVPSRGGVFEVVADGDLVYSKKRTGRHPEHDDVLASLRERASDR